ncbi:Peptidyl-tRNA hydrolase, mitochondrial [Vitis vinifera]|uniref:Peptidyl-tRNA hydrolase, mitochondrial n=1 Tax=Vitis vinifera TaxID=29760 RepID=A0A438DKX2_VITVI|nr:Peptidyl-tRNA hydrolase, mitochondrial [Vitis vinifera]
MRREESSHLDPQQSPLFLQLRVPQFFESVRQCFAQNLSMGCLAMKQNHDFIACFRPRVSSFKVAILEAFPVLYSLNVLVGQLHAEAGRDCSGRKVDTLQEIPMDTVHYKEFFRQGCAGDVPVFLAKPWTYMDLSGKSAGPLAAYCKLPLDSVVVFHDDIGLPWGLLRLHHKGGRRNHNGLMSVILYFRGNREFLRPRVDVGKPVIDPHFHSTANLRNSNTIHFRVWKIDFSKASCYPDIILNCQTGSTENHLVPGSRLPTNPFSHSFLFLTPSTKD